jgi:hypothetical protein
VCGADAAEEDPMTPTTRHDLALTCIGPAPAHLRARAWYLPHQAWLARRDLPHHDAEGAAPEYASMWGADLCGADLRDARLTGADLTEARLTGADLHGARLACAVLLRADLTGATLTGADLTGADLTGAVLTDAVLTDAEWSLLEHMRRHGLAVPDPRGPVPRLAEDVRVELRATAERLLRLAGS